ncbi:hypothetical protein [Brumimicrobium oceani]|uniref:Outer membrane protein beta-barrel domain-containing protein n=1 Tax=Brumimicrobium oceani TaxID=2100725 RepID=A0A2U2XFX8_9FLAO|nr:hypothetical protein [Brumimicrobium oceani]PWH86611.1 hypothetical protein DIT68_05085 [Brumimicrobium oceani]
MKTTGITFYILVSFFLISNSIQAQFALDAETGALFTGYNDVRIPGDQGTFFSLKDDIQSATTGFIRIRANYTLKKRHTFSLLYAPLKTIGTGKVEKDILFNGKTFLSNTVLASTYKFNSYRLTYRYRIVDRPKFKFGLGFTAKIRDAGIGLSSATLNSIKTNVGFVPIINFRLWYKLTDQFGLVLEGDALAAPQGRAEDIQLAVSYNYSNNFDFRLGYRILEGGADNNEVYNFSLFHYASLGITYTFNP